MSNGTSGAPPADAGKPGEGTELVNQSSQIGDMLSDFVPENESEDEGEKEKGKETGEETSKETVTTDAEDGKTEETEEDSKASIKSLQATIQALTDKVSLLETGKQPAADGGGKEEPEKPTVFLKDKAEYDSVFERPEVFNEILNRVATAGGEKVLKALPKIIRTVVQQQVDMQTKTAKFFAGNKDLLQHRQFASFVANDMIGQNPNWTLDKLYTELGGEVRKRLGLKAGAVANAGKKGAGAFPGTKGTGARQVAGKSGQLTPIEQEIKDLIE